MIALLRSTDGNPDSRFEKYISYITQYNIPYLTICWDRFRCKTTTNNNLYYRRPAKYGEGIKNVIGLIGFNIFLLKSLIARRSDYKVIHAADFDTVLPAMFMKLFYNKRIIYDIYDWYIDSRQIKNKWLKKTILLIEHFILSKSDVVIICEQGRKSQIRFEPRNLWVLPNIPHLSVQKQGEFQNTSKLIISYVGVLSTDRGLRNLIELARNHSEISFIVGGFGPMERDFIKAAEEMPNLNFRGRVSYVESFEIMNSSNMIYAMYELINPNHIYAAPNKFYEGLALGKPIITTKGTLVGDNVLRHNTGYCIDESYNSLNDLILNFDRKEYLIKSKNAIGLWKNKYAQYTSSFMIDKYMKFIVE